ncbi:MAG: CoxD-like protein [bacterium]|nr:MAG: CoxD-like protein [bacterium]
MVVANTQPINTQPLSQQNLSSTNIISGNNFAFYEGFGSPNPAMAKNLENVKQLQRKLAEADYHIDAKITYSVYNWLELNIEPLILQGGPGTGKSRLVVLLAEIYGLNYYNFQCFDGIKPRDVLYRWNSSLQDLLTKAIATQNSGNISKIKEIIYSSDCRIDGVLLRALLDPKPSLVRFDEIDKVGSEFEAGLLQVSEEGKITISETNEEIKPVSGVRTRIIATSNAGGYGMRECLSHPFLRRSKVINLGKPSLLRQFLLLKERFPGFEADFIKEVVMFSDRVDEYVDMIKPMDLSELIKWIYGLRLSGITKLSKETVAASIDSLAKIDLDKDNLLLQLGRILDFIQDNKHMDIRELSRIIEAGKMAR